MRAKHYMKNNWLDRPFPFMESSKQKVFSALGFAGFIYAFLLIFQPFQISEVKLNIPIYLLGFFFITFFVALFSAFALPSIFPAYFDVEKWKIRKSILFNSLIMIAIGILNWVYNHSLGSENAVDHSILSFIFITVAVGVFPSAFFILIAEKYLTQRNTTIAQSIEHSIKEPHPAANSALISITTDSEKDKLTIHPDDLVCIKSEGNYVKVFYYDSNHSLKNKLMRNTLTNLTSELSDNEFLKRCHRSYMANFNHVKKVSGNARNYSLHFDHLDFTVPLSRSFPINNPEKVDTL